ncbi:hypothetical protein [Streptomyces sp. NBC_00829]|uniref:hypothetical protein n=1 Tax=Streptomyces sp. NBC_00829 TaxID=2903679 RepID=UPI00386734AA|nr:hypothetical protein OG293_16900 [Streptomyces sp. NBC_00829]
MDSLIAAVSAAALALIVTSARGLSRVGSNDPSAEARSVTLALYGGVVAVLALALFIVVT